MNKQLVLLAALISYVTASTIAQPITAILGAYSAENDLILEKTVDKKQVVIENVHFTEGTKGCCLS